MCIRDSVNGVRASALRFADERTQCLLQTLPLFRMQPDGFTSKELRANLAQFIGLQPDQMRPGRGTYHLRRLKLRGLIERIPKSNRYRVTDAGLRISLFYTCAYNRILRPGIADTCTPLHDDSSKIAAALSNLQTAIDRQCEPYKLAA